MRSLLRMLFPKWEKRWCVVTSAIGRDYQWWPYQCWFRNGEIDMRYAFLLVHPVENEAVAINVAAEFNKVEVQE